MEKVELRRKRIINFLYLALILGLTYLFFKYFFGMFFPFIFALFVAIAVQKPADFIVNKTKLKKGFTATAMVLLLYIAIGIVIFFLGAKLVDAFKNFFIFITGKISDFPALVGEIKAWTLHTLTILPDKLEAKVLPSVSQWFETVGDKSASEFASSLLDSASGEEGFSISTFTTPLSGIWSTAKRIPSVFVATVIAILSSCFMAADYDWISSFLKNQLSDKNKHKLSVSKRVVFTSLGKLLRSYIIIILITGTEVFIGLNVLSLLDLYKGGNIFVISLIIALLDILPVFGTGTVMIPWAIYSLITGRTGLAIGLFIVYAIIYVVRQVIEPKIVGGTVGLPPFLTLMGMYIGSQLFGFIGIFLLPILMIIVKLLNDEGVIHLWKSSKPQTQEAGTK